MRFLPSTRLGRIACWLAVAFVAFFIANQALIGLWDATSMSPWGAARGVLIAWGILGLSTGLVAGVLALVAVLRRRERGVAVFLAMVPGLFVLLFVLGELLFPH